MRNRARALVLTAAAAGAMFVGGGVASAAEAPSLPTLPGLADLIAVDTIDPLYDAIAEGLDSDLLREGLSGILFG